MNNLRVLNGRPRPITAGGETHNVHPLTLSDLGDLQAWIDCQFPDPFALASEQLQGGRWTVEQEKWILRCAMEEASKARPRLGTAEADQLLDTFEGRQEILYLAIKKGEPTFTRERARAFLEKLNEAEAAGALDATDVGMVSDPKAA